MYICLWMYLNVFDSSTRSTHKEPSVHHRFNPSAVTKFEPATACQNLWYHLLMTAPWLSTWKKHRWRGRARFKKRYKFIKPRVVVMKTKRGEQKVSNLMRNEDPCHKAGSSYPYLHGMPCQENTKPRVRTEVNMASSVLLSTSTSPPPLLLPPAHGEKDSHIAWEVQRGEEEQALWVHRIDLDCICTDCYRPCKLHSIV